jgi:hypothetical protein
MSKQSAKNELAELMATGESIPTRFTLNPEKYRVLFGKPGLDHYVTQDGEVVSIEDQQIFKKYFPESFVFINVSKQFPDEL